MTQVIAFMGTKGSGKDTAAALFKSALVEKNMVCERIAFADPIREMMLALDPIVGVMKRYTDVVDDIGYEQAKSFPEVRRLLQVLGTEAGRDILGENVWVNHLVSRVHDSDADVVVVTDLRFINEYDALSKLPNTKFVRVARQHVADNDTHASENQWKTIIPDEHIDNNGNLAELDKAVSVLINDLVVPPVRAR